MYQMDFHCHSTFSDGTLTPTQLVITAKAIGLSGLALTDHDNVDGVEEFKEAGRRYNFTTLGGVELSADYSGVTHILGLETSVEKELKLNLDDLKKYREDRNKKMFEKLISIGLSLSWERLLKLAEGAVMGKPHFALALMEKGYARNNDDAFDKYLGKGKPGYVNKKRLSAKDAIKILLEGDLAPVLAHPKSMGLTYQEYIEVIKEFKEEGLVGLEVFHPSHSYHHTLFFMCLASENNLVATCGSDYHGANKKVPLNWTIKNSTIDIRALEKLDKALIDTQVRLDRSIPIAQDYAQK
jgi:predicted metal-dependent phosphoesterase TrpH